MEWRFFKTGFRLIPDQEMNSCHGMVFTGRPVYVI